MDNEANEVEEGKLEDAGPPAKIARLSNGDGCDHEEVLREYDFRQGASLVVAEEEKAKSGSSDDDFDPASKFANLGDVDGWANYDQRKEEKLTHVKEDGNNLPRDAVKQDDDSSDDNDVLDVTEREALISTEKQKKKQSGRKRITSNHSTSSSEGCNTVEISDGSGSEDSVNKEQSRNKFSSILHDVQMVFSGRVRYEEHTDKEELIPLEDITPTSEASEAGRERSLSTGMNPKSDLAFGLADVALAAVHKAKVEGGIGGVDKGKIGRGGGEAEGERKEKDDGDRDGDGSGENGDKPKRRVTFSGDLDVNDWEKHSGNCGDKPNFTRKVTFEGCEEDLGNSSERESGGDDNKNEQNTTHHTKPRRRRVGIMLDDGVDHSKLCDMLSEMGDYGEKKNHRGRAPSGDGGRASGGDTWMVKTVSNLDAKPVNIELHF